MRDLVVQLQKFLDSTVFSAKAKLALNKRITNLANNPYYGPTEGAAARNRQLFEAFLPSDLNAAVMRTDRTWVAGYIMVLRMALSTCILRRALDTSAGSIREQALAMSKVMENLVQHVGWIEHHLDNNIIPPNVRENAVVAVRNFKVLYGDFCNTSVRTKCHPPCKLMPGNKCVVSAIPRQEEATLPRGAYYVTRQS